MFTRRSRRLLLELDELPGRRGAVQVGSRWFRHLPSWRVHDLCGGLHAFPPEPSDEWLLLLVLFVDQAGFRVYSTVECFLRDFTSFLKQ